LSESEGDEAMCEQFTCIHHLEKRLVVILIVIEDQKENERENVDSIVETDLLLIFGRNNNTLQLVEGEKLIQKYLQEWK